MRKIYVLFVFIVLLMFPLLNYAQFTVSAELRPRAEMDNGIGLPRPDSADASYYVTQRTRLQFDYAKEKYQMRLTIQDVRYWGSGDVYSPTGVFGTYDGLDIREAWLSLKLCEYSKLTIGRQELKLDEQRLIAGRNWNQYGLTYDALRYTMERNRWTLNVAVSYNNNIKLLNGREITDEELFDSPNIMKSFNFIHLNRRFNDKLQSSIMAIGAAYQSPDNNSTLYMMGTYGIWLKYDQGVFDISTNLYYQNGKAQTGKDVMAYMATLHPGVKFSGFRFGIGADYFSGDNAENDDYGEKARTFNKMYGAVFKYYGYMNYYTFMPKSTSNGGLIDIYPNISASFAKIHNLKLLFHKFYLANPVFYGNMVEDDRDLGAEIDLMYTVKPMDDLVVQAGFSYYITTATLEKVKNVDGADLGSPYWAWVMVTFTPRLFSTN